MRSSKWAWALVVLAALGCGGSSSLAPDGSATLGLEGRPEGSFTTDSVAYTARQIQEPWASVPIYGFTVVTRFTNPTSAPLYLWTCYPDAAPPVYSVLAADGGFDGVAYNAAWACVGHDRPIRVDPGGTRIDTITVRGPNRFDGITHQPIDRVVEGKFQLQFAVQSCRAEGDCAIRDHALTRSNEFTVHLSK